MAQAEQAPLIRVQDVTVRFGRRTALDSVSLTLSPGEVVTVVGLNGAGKTTLARVVLGLQAPTAGTLWRRPGLRVGYVPQHLNRDPALPLSTRRFVELGGPAARRRLEEVAAEVGLQEALDAPLADISGGELRRAMLARALARGPHLLVLDEPMSGVDVTGQAELYELIADIRRRRGCGVLLVSHDLHLVMRATDHVLCLNGHVCCTGHPERVTSDPGFIELFGEDVARTMGVYVHHHDHRHAPDGSVVPAEEDAPHG
jgi:zinc transport system ATP-binding protein